MDKLIKEIESEKYQFKTVNGIDDGVMESAHNYALDAAIEIIRKHLEGRVIVPVEVLRYLDGELKDCPDKLTLYPPKDKYEAIVVNIKPVITKLLSAHKEASDEHK